MAHQPRGGAEERPAAAEALSLLSLLAPDAIPACRLLARVGEVAPNDAAAACPAPWALGEAADADERQETVEELLGVAQRYSLLEFDEGGGVGARVAVAAVIGGGGR